MPRRCRGPTEEVLEQAELYWITTVRPDGRPHVTPLIGLWFGGAMHFTTGLTEQKARNLEQNPRVVVTTGNNTWDHGLDVTVRPGTGSADGRRPVLLPHVKMP
ncbi:MAG: hypothetical protein GEV09_26410, partial [Pseudonocardiaceae bacterium]|nr:hypothetical protein [Pseudonocardiaceae bacterium]